jgi:Icc-related predicted phosphoesterase
MTYRHVVSLLSLALVGACAKKEQEPPPSPPPAAAQAPKAPEPAKTDPACVGPITTGTPEALTIAGVAWELNGSTMTMKSPAKDTLVLGLISDIKEDSDENKANVLEIAKWFTKSGADLILVAGDTGETAAEIQSSLDILAANKVPVFAIIGNREGKHDHAAALSKARAEHGNVFNLNTVRRVVTPLLEVISMPGYFNPRYIHAADGCAYQAADVASVAQLAALAKAPTLLISHGGPKQEGPLGVDRTSEGDNVGDPALAKVLADAKIPFGVFGNIHEAGGHATDLAGRTLVKPGEFAPSFYLHPGPADAVRWLMNDKSESVGMAAVMTVKGGKAKYEVLRLADPEKAAKGKHKGKGKK